MSEEDKQAGLNIPGQLSFSTRCPPNVGNRKKKITMKIRPSIAISDNGFLFDPGSGESYTTNPVAKEILFMLKQNHSPEEIKSSLLAKYEVDEITLEKNLIDFYAMLRHYNLCEETGR